MKKNILFIALLALVIQSCAKRTDIGQSKGVALTGYIFNVETGNPVKNAKILLAGSKDTLSITSATGKYAFDVPVGVYNLIIEKKGFQTSENKIKLAVKKDYNFDIILLTKRELTPQEKEAQVHLTNAVSAFNDGDIKKANDEIVTAFKLTPENKTVVEYTTKISERLGTAVDSLFTLTLALQSEKKNEEALKALEELLKLDPENKEALDKLNSIKTLLAEKPKPKPEPKPKSKPEVNVESIYKEGLSLFSQGKYKVAIGKFNTVLNYKPGHSGAKTYRAKAQKRLKALGG